jgi:hypothetical protein
LFIAGHRHRIIITITVVITTAGTILSTRTEPYAFTPTLPLPLPLNTTNSPLTALPHRVPTLTPIVGLAGSRPRAREAPDAREGVGDELGEAEGADAVAAEPVPGSEEE